MTKRDVTVWFCRVIALQGLLSSILSLFGATFSWYFGRVWGTAIYSVPALALYGAVWLFAIGIGTELAAEGEDGPPLESGAQLGALLVRCAGFWMFLAASSNFGLQILIWVYSFYFEHSPGMASYSRVMMPYIISGFLQSIIGFLLAFTPRIRRAFAK